MAKNAVETVARLHRGVGADVQEMTTGVEEAHPLVAGRHDEGAFLAAVAGPSLETEDVKDPYPERGTTSLHVHSLDLEAALGQMKGNSAAVFRRKCTEHCILEMFCLNTS